MARVPKRAESVGLLPDDGRVFARGIWVHIINVAADGTVTTAGQVNLPLDKTGFVLDEVRVKGNRCGSKNVIPGGSLEKCADTSLTSTLRRIVGHS
jgi:hypothetical protein